MGGQRGLDIRANDINKGGGIVAAGSLRRKKNGRTIFPILVVFRTVETILSRAGQILGSGTMDQKRTLGQQKRKGGREILNVSHEK